MLSRHMRAAGFAIGAWALVAAAQRPEPVAAIARRVERVEGRVARAEAVRAIKRLQYAYGHYVEFGLWNDFADLFTDDAITNYQQGARGKDAIRRLFFEQVGQGKLGLADGRIYPHILFQPVITLAPDGGTAKGRWRILAMLGGYGGNATWYSGVYENEYVRENGVWKISLLRSEPKVTAAYTASGWKDSGTHVPLHFTAASVTEGLRDSGSRGAQPGESLAALAGRVNEIARRAARLEDQGAVTNLLDTYGYAMDGKLWDQAADLFAEDGTLELGLRGVYVGKAHIRHALDQFGPQGLRDGELNDHVYLQTLVTVAPDGRAAQARGVEVIMSSAPGGRNAELSEGVFENTFVRRDGSWKIQSVHFYPRMIVDASTGWAKSAKPAPGASKEFAPDRPPTVSYEIYPKFAVAPFHFDNPVTGKPPQYPEGVRAVARPGPSAGVASKAPAIRNAAELEAALATAERRLRAAEAYDAAENLIGAYAYYLDEAPADAGGLFVEPGRAPASESSVFVNQMVQPVIEVAEDGMKVNVRARRLDLSGTSGGPGYWKAGTLEGQIVMDQGSWKFQTVRPVSRWTAAYPGGWGQRP